MWWIIWIGAWAGARGARYGSVEPFSKIAIIFRLELDQSANRSHILAPPTQQESTRTDRYPTTPPLVFLSYRISEPQQVLNVMVVKEEVKEVIEGARRTL